MAVCTCGARRRAWGGVVRTAVLNCDHTDPVHCVQFNPKYVMLVAACWTIWATTWPRSTCRSLIGHFAPAVILKPADSGIWFSSSWDFGGGDNGEPSGAPEDGPFCAGALQLGEGADLGAFYGQLRAMFWQVPRPQLLVRDTTLGQGRFGPVRAGVVHRDGNDLSVGVQRCSAQWMLPDRERRQLLAEIEGMVRLGVHPNVVLFIGACEDQEFLQLVVEHPPRSLRGLLLTSRHSSEGRVCSLEERQLLELAKGVAAGMCHLARHGVHHGQLSTRSITVVDDLVPKISNFGLARYTPLGKGERNHKPQNPGIPGSFPATVRSDPNERLTEEWSSGTPYVNLKTAEVAERVTRGLRLSQPKGVRENMYQLMLQCWELDRDERPTFEQLLGSLQEMLCGEIPVKFSHTPGYTYERFDPLADET
ncbi:hypothetical protein HPB47_002841 [Ixodes persulcatus]|uniref:Uncharacterized protein n=1 Tax=Ixodes persulcatus TaxID=34615 RepID=A0AC60PK27_IXOPE|nr:hypothetical protein HPB47_002841 [Ixodes persulcatus]